MIRPVLIATALLTFGGAVALAQTLPAPPAAPKPVLMVLTPQDIDPARLLPPPATSGSDAQKAELVELHRLQDQRTPARLDQAVWDQGHEEWHMYAQLLGPKFDLTALPATARVLGAVQNDNKIAANRAKDFFKRRRPWAEDKSLQGCPREGER
jgi:acid phosphatase (class A)